MASRFYGLKKNERIEFFYGLLNYLKYIKFFMVNFLEVAHQIMSEATLPPSLV